MLNPLTTPTLSVSEPTENLSPEEHAKLKTYRDNIDLSNTNAIIQYGVASQNQMVSFSENILRSVKNSDMGEIGDLLTSLSLEVKGFDAASTPPTGLAKLFFSLKRKIESLKVKYSRVESNLNGICKALEKHVQVLLKDIYMFDKQYDENWKYYKELTLLILAGEEKMTEVREQILPAMKAEANDTQDPQKIQQCTDLENQINRFEKKIHDLKLSRTISISLAPQIRMVQNNCSTMMEKIQSTIFSTLPLWKNHMVLALGIAHSQQALSAQKAVADATNTLLRKNSEMLRQTTVEIAQANERGIVDLETIREANNNIIASLGELITIQEEGRKNRMEVEKELIMIESELKTKLLSNTAQNR